MFAHANPLGFFAGSRAQHVSHIIGKTEEIVTALGMNQADLKPAADALTAAKALYAVREYSEAAAQAKRAGTLAVRLNERFNAYIAAWTALQERMEELRHVGFPTVDLEAALGAAEKEMARPIEEDGAVVPNYLGAKALLERAAEDARTLLVRAKEASREIFLATLAVEGLTEPQPTQPSSWIAIRLEEMLQQATRELALGNVSAAHRLASEAKGRADEARVDAARARGLLEEAILFLDRLSADGVVADRLEGRIGSVRGALAQGFLDLATTEVVVRRLSDEAVSLADNYPRARGILGHAERVYSRLREEGFCSYDVDEALVQARRALEAGDWAGVRENVRRASESFVRRRKEREALAKAIADFHGRVALLKDVDLPLLPDVQEILGRAEEEFQSGRYSGANEDLLLVTVLMTQPIRPGA